MHGETLKCLNGFDVDRHFIQIRVFILRIRVVFSNNLYVILQELILLVGHKFQLPELNFLLIFS